MKRALNYNEKKVQKKEAELIHAGNFLKLPEEMSFHDKYERFDRLMQLNDRAKTKTIHISLNFHPSEKERLTKEFLIQLSDEYMERIGFGNQPYLVYQHNDIIHPHMHIVSTLIREDGSRINTHHLGKDISDPARKEMEIKYGLVSSNKKQWNQHREKQLVVNVRKVQYGKSETLRAITNVLDTVIDRYKYTSLPELNAVLKQYNVMADRGSEEGRIYKTRGLTYRILDEQGQKVGVPVKASAIYSKPTLNYLEKKFAENEQRREPDRKHLKTILDWTMRKEPRSMEELLRMLEKERVAAVIRRGEQGRIYGLTYIDHGRKAVFNGSDLGKEYSAKRMLERLSIGRQPEQEKVLTPGKQKAQEQEQRDREQRPQPETGGGKDQQPSIKDSVVKTLSKTIEWVMKPEGTDEQLAYELREEQKRKRKRAREQNREM